AAVSPEPSSGTLSTTPAPPAPAACPCRPRLETLQHSRSTRRSVSSPSAACNCSASPPRPRITTIAKDLPWPWRPDQLPPNFCHHQPRLAIDYRPCTPPADRRGRACPTSCVSDVA